MEEAKPNWIPLLVWLTVAFAFNFVQIRFANEGLEFWFQTLSRPSWALPVIFVAPIATAISAVVGVALSRLWNSDTKWRVLPLLALEAAVTIWSYLFFIRHELERGWIFAAAVSGLALACMAMLRINKWATVATLLIAVWLGYWSACNYSILKNAAVDPVSAGLVAPE